MSARADRAPDEETKALQQAVERLAERTWELADKNERLRELDRLKSEFVASVSHELRTPLTSIHTAAGILVEYPDEKPETRLKFAGLIQREAARLMDLVNNLLDVAKIEAGRIVWNLGVCLLGDVVDRAVEAITPVAAGRGIRIDVDRERALPALYGDRDRLQQALLNLVGNAVKFSPDGSAVSVSAGLSSGPPPRLFAAVADRGPGIPEARLGSLFRKFEQIPDGVQGKPAGTGLGLAIAKEIVEAHGGRIEVESKEGEGSTFRIVLPPWDRVSEFRSLLAWRIRQAAARGQPLGILVLGADGTEDPAALAKRLRARIVEVVRSATDAVVFYEHAGHAAVLAESRAQGMESIRSRALARIREQGLGDGLAEPAAWRTAVAEYPRDGADTAEIAARLDAQLESGPPSPEP